MGSAVKIEKRGKWDNFFEFGVLVTIPAVTLNFCACFFVQYWGVLGGALYTLFYTVVSVAGLWGYFVP